MRKTTIRLGVHLITAAISLITLATFFHGAVARLLSLSVGTETSFVFLALGWGGAIGCTGIIIAVSGLFRGERTLHDPVKLIPSLLMLITVTVFFFILLFSSFHRSLLPDMNPGETVII